MISLLDHKVRPSIRVKPVWYKEVSNQSLSSRPNGERKDNMESAYRDTQYAQSQLIKKSTYLQDFEVSLKSSLSQEEQINNGKVWKEDKFKTGIKKKLSRKESQYFKPSEFELKKLDDLVEKVRVN